MDIKYDDYLNAGTKKLMEFLSSPDVDDGEREAIVSAFSGELSDNIANINKMDDEEALIYSASIKYIDSQISKILANSEASYGDYDKAIRLCTRAQEMLQLFSVKKWNLPKLSNTDFGKCEEILRKRQESTSLSSKIIAEDRKIDELTQAAQSQLSVKICDEALSLIEELANDIAKCKQSKNSLPAINNKDTKKASKKIAELRKVAEQKEDLHQNILGVDAQINSISSLSKTTPEQWQEIISLCQKQMGLMADCTRKSWPLPAVNCNNPSALANKYKHYQQMKVLDQSISSNRASLESGKQYKTFFANCNQQINSVCSLKYKH